MMRTIIMIVLLMLPIKAIAPDMKYLCILDGNKVNMYEQLWNAVCTVESNNNPLAKNFEKGGWSIGISQIRQCRIDEYNKQTGKNYKLEDCFNPAVSKEIFMYYCKGSDLCKIARSWNGSGKQTWNYWELIEANL